MQTRDIGVVGSNPIRITIKALFLRKATGNRLMKSTSLEEEPRALVSPELIIEYAPQ